MQRSPRFAAILLTLTAALVVNGCKRPAADDATVTAAVQTKIAADSALGSEPIQSSVQAGIATLSGSVSSQAARVLAANDAAQVPGVKTVVNNLTVQTAAAAPAPLPEPVQQTAPAAAPPIAVNTPRERIPTRPVKPSPALERQKLTRDQSPPAPIIERTPPPATPTTTPAVTSAAPPQPPQPTYRELSVPSGTSIPIRITQTLDSASAQEGQAFSGSVTSDVLVDGLVAIPQGSAVAGRVDAVQEAAHFKGNSLLTISLTSISRRGERIPITTDPYSKQGAGRGKNTATKTGVGAAAGAILGGIFGGGSGAAIGAAAGGGAGAGINGVTRGEQVQIPSESVVSFRLTNPISVRVRTDRNADSATPPDGARRPLP